MSASDEKPMGTVKLKTLQKTGERQVGAQLEDIRADHLARYMWAAERVKKTDRVLDAGCGVGYGAHMLSRVCKSVLAVDSDGDAIDFAQERWSSPNVEFRVGNLHSPDFEENQKFNVVVAFEIIEHLVRPNLFLISLREHLAPGARLYISSPNERVIHHTVELNPFHIRHYTPEALKDLLEDAGFLALDLYSQNDDELSKGDDGRTIIIECTPAPITTDKALTQKLRKQALFDAENELIVRSNLIRKLQSVLKKKDRLDGMIESRIAEVDDETVKQNLESLREMLIRQRAGLFADMLDGATGSAADVIAQRVSKDQNRRLDADLATLLDQFEQQRSSLTDMFDQRVAGLLEFQENERQAALHTGERERLTLLELRQVEEDLETALEAARAADERVENFETQNALLLTRINQMTAALNTQTFEIANRKKNVDRLEDELARAIKKVEQLTERSVKQDEQLLALNGAQALKSKLAALEKTRAGELRRFDPDRPTVMGLARVTLRHGFFIKMLLTAPYNSLVNILKTLQSKS